MSRDTDCPYCGAAVEINHDDGYGYEEDMLYQQECEVCAKTFVFRTSISLSYEPRQADCLNGAEHQWERTTTLPPEFARLRCAVCEEEKPLPKEANAS